MFCCLPSKFQLVFYLLCLANGKTARARHEAIFTIKLKKKNTLLLTPELNKNINIMYSSVLTHKKNFFDFDPFFIFTKRILKVI